MHDNSAMDPFVAISNELLLRCLDAVYRSDIKYAPRLDDSPEQISHVGGLGRAACVSPRWARLVNDLCQTPDWRSVLVKLGSATDIPGTLRHQAAADLYLKQRPQLALVFASAAVNPGSAQLVQSVREGLNSVIAPETPIICVNCPGGVLGPESSSNLHYEQRLRREQVQDDGPAIAATTLRFPKATIRTFAIEKKDLSNFAAYPADVFESECSWSTVILFGSAKCEANLSGLIGRFYELNPKVRVIGGLATDVCIDAGGHCAAPAGGVVGVAFSDSIASECVCSRGCEPISHPYRVIECTDGELRTVADHRGMEWPFLKLIFQNYSNYVAIGASTKEEPAEGYTLCSIGLCQSGVTVSVDRRVLPGHFVQLCEMTHKACKQDVTGRLAALAHARCVSEAAPIVGGVLFGCSSRGDDFDKEEPIDAAAFSAGFPDIPLSGFVTARTLGPEVRVLMEPAFVAEGNTQSVVQGKTSVFGLFSSAQRTWDGVAAVSENPELASAMAKLMGIRVKRLRKGQRVTVQGLKGAPQHNGKEGVIRKWLPEKERYQVKADEGDVLALRTANIMLVIPK